MLRVAVTVAFVCVCVCMVALPAKASPLGLTLLDHPDIASYYIHVDYNAGTDNFNATGVALTFDDDGIHLPLYITDGVFSIDATVDELGNPTGGTLSITGDVLGYSPTLLTGNLTDFGFQDPPDGGDPFEFLFTVSGGELAIPYYGGLGSVVGVILSAVDGGFDGTFDADFSNSGFGVADTAPIPEPTSLALLAAVGALLSARRGRRRA